MSRILWIVLCIASFVFSQQQDLFEITPRSGFQRKLVKNASVYIVNAITQDSLLLSEYTGSKAGTYYRADVPYGRYKIYVDDSVVKEMHTFGTMTTVADTTELKRADTTYTRLYVVGLDSWFTKSATGTADKVTTYDASGGGYWVNVEHLQSNIIRPEWAGAAGDGTTDDATALQTTLDAMADGDVLEFSKTYLIGSDVSVAGLNDIIIRGKSGATIKAASNTTQKLSFAGDASWTSGFNGLYYKSLDSSAFVLSAADEVVRGHYRIAIQDSTQWGTINEWDLVQIGTDVLHSNTTDAWYAVNNFFDEFREIGGVQYMYFKKPFLWSFDLESLYYQSSYSKYHIRVVPLYTGIRLENLTTENVQLEIYQYRGAVIDGLSALNVPEENQTNSYGLTVTNCQDVKISNYRVDGKLRSGSGYGIALSDLQDVRITDSFLWNCRHSVGLTAGLEPNFLRDITVESSTVGIDTLQVLDGYGGYLLDIHPACYNIKLGPNLILYDGAKANSVTIRGDWVTIDGMEINDGGLVNISDQDKSFVKIKDLTIQGEHRGSYKIINTPAGTYIKKLVIDGLEYYGKHYGGTNPRITEFNDSTRVDTLIFTNSKIVGVKNSYPSVLDFNNTGKIGIESFKYVEFSKNVMTNAGNFINITTRAPMGRLNFWSNTIDKATSYLTLKTATADDTTYKAFKTLNIQQENIYGAETAFIIDRVKFDKFNITNNTFDYSGRFSIDGFVGDEVNIMNNTILGYMGIRFILLALPTRVNNINLSNLYFGPRNATALSQLNTDLTAAGYSTRSEPTEWRFFDSNNNLNDDCHVSINNNEMYIQGLNSGRSYLAIEGGTADVYGNIFAPADSSLGDNIPFEFSIGDVNIVKNYWRHSSSNTTNTAVIWVPSGIDSASTNLFIVDNLFHDLASSPSGRTYDINEGTVTIGGNKRIGYSSANSTTGAGELTTTDDN